MTNPTDVHLQAAKHILRHLKVTLTSSILLKPGPIFLSAFLDADWASDPSARRSTTGFIAFLGSNPITWAAKKQPAVSRSSTEAEYRALASTAAELPWLRMQELHIYLLKPPLLWCDNLPALALASNPVFHSRTKHIEVDYLFEREQVVQKDIQAQFISTKDQLGNILAKFLLLGLLLFVSNSR